jgi:thymidylate synthase (FAD)
MTVKLIAYTHGVEGATPEELLASAFSKCYQRPPNIDAVLRNLNHESVLEHISFTLDIEVSRVTWEQIVRHRLASYTAQSHRYTEPSAEDVDFYIPSEVPDEFIDEWSTDAFLSYQVYKKWRARGITKQTARYLLPKGVSIKATVTMNLRSLLNFLKLRLDPKAQEEVRLFAEEVWQEVRPLFPRLEEALEGKFRK